jgi:hypothetical protein
LTRRRVWRRPDHRAAAEAKWRFDRWAGSLQAITSAIDDANRHLARCEQTEHELTGPYRHYQEAHEAQVERDRWLATHPGDVAWADDLVQRINTRTTQLGAESAQSQPQPDRSGRSTPVESWWCLQPLPLLAMTAATRLAEAVASWGSGPRVSPARLGGLISHLGGSRRSEDNNVHIAVHSDW